MPAIASDTVVHDLRNETPFQEQREAIHGPEQKPYIEFQNVHKAFGSNVVLDGVSFDVMPGETVCILGRSGVGKSVSLHQIMGFLKPDSGRIWVAYEDTTDYPERELERIRKKVTMVFQNGALFDSLTVGENVAYGLREQFWNRMTRADIEARVKRSLELVGLPGVASMRPSDLSGGMKKRVGLARTLALEPEVILYDEPTTGLDPINTARINHLIRGIQRSLKLTSVVVTHDMGTAFNVSDRLAMIGKGRMLLVGTKEDFRTATRREVRDFIEGNAPESEDLAALLSSS